MGQAGLLEMDRLAKELRQHAANALASQSACNLSGVVHSFSLAMKTLCDIKLDTKWRNKHPISVLFAKSVDDIVGFNAEDNWLRDHAVRWCERVAGDEREAMREVRLAMGSNEQ